MTPASDRTACARQRRRLLGIGALGMFAGTRFALAELMATPPQLRGPFYPLTLPLDQDNDLVRVDGREGLAQGVVTDVAGRILDTSGRPLAGASVEIWQVNAFGRYHHPHDDSEAPIDPLFQGYGRTLTDSEGGYRFRTIRPVPYPGRAPHIHFGVQVPGRDRFFTQMYVAGAPENTTDFLLRALRTREAREALVVPLTESRSQTARLTGRFDIVLGRTPVSDTR